ncbi:hypothetical protein E4V99_07500 [Microbacterium sp. dk485]|uniref:helix-turn-helix domain-containing protein n=1 Tax=Microbacterium TaxID=33882 RepID=UPI001073AC53|nr:MULTISPECIES: helix-turn-helix domain-containing protein [Microbacterium]TFV84877.1 hypothetical protein E4V99_07500 [Microbacterium sp. dk485]TXK11673.1 hypothetical protein FVP99_14745 [Microbacterium wangchenii]
MAFADAPSRLSDAARFDSALRARVRQARKEFLSGATRPDLRGVSSEIYTSWVRSRELGVDAASTAVPLNPLSVTRARRLVDAATPVMTNLADQCRDSDAWGMLLDRECVQVFPLVGDARVVREGEQRGGGLGATFQEAVVGTNGAGISVERLESFLVVGEEHFREAEHNLASVGVPLRDPYGRMAGVLLMCQRLSSANHMIVPYTQTLAVAIEKQLALATSGDERALFEAFARHSRRPSLAVVGISEDVYIANNAAQQLLRDGAETDALREAVLAVADAGRSRLMTLTFEEERYRVHCRIVQLSAGRNGVVASLSRVAAPPVLAPGRRFEPPAPAADPVARAKDLGFPVLVTGEPGSGRAHRVRSVASVVELDAAAAATDGAAWMAQCRELLSRGDVLIRHLDALPPTLRPGVLELIRAGAHWVAATVESVSPDFEATFPVTVAVLPLRERTADLPALVEALLADLGAARTRRTPEVMSILARYPWPGNVAQLRRLLAGILVRLEGDTISIDDLPREIASSGRRNTGEGLLARTERELVFDALREANWNRDAAAKTLGISRATMYRRIRQFGFQIPSSR